MNEDWKGALKECETVEQFNMLALALARERRRAGLKDGFAKAVVEEARRRKYIYTGTRESGVYVDITPEEYAAVMTRLERLERRDGTKRLAKALRRTKVNLVQAAWEEWIFRGSAAENLGALLILDFRKTKDNQCIYEFDMVPRDLYLKLFESDAKRTLKQIYTMFKGQSETEVRNWKEAS